MTDWHQHRGNLECDECGKVCPAIGGWDEYTRTCAELEAADQAR